MPIERRLTTQDISWFLDLYANKQLELDPPYQRRSVWSPKDRRFFLDTIFRGFPSPSIFLHKEIDQHQTIYSVVDGKQRLETIIKFAKNEIPIDKDFGDTRLDGKKWETIRRDEKLARAFWDYVIPVEFTTVIDSSVVNEMFDRLNRNSRKLTEQEMRHAKYDGWFITFVEREAASREWIKLKVVTTARARRMADVQFISELFIILLKCDVTGFDQSEISKFYADYDNLADLGIPFDEELVTRIFENTKSYLFKLESLDSVVSKYARDVTNFYSLWAVVALNSDRLPPVRKFSKQYSDFMDRVNKYRDTTYLEKVIRDKEAPSETLSLTYYQNSTGARTELRQRRARHKFLLQELFGEAPVHDENT
ncbi:MAG: DUF262 domain-containing protein [Desulfomonilaceae bacterium]